MILNQLESQTQESNHRHKDFQSPAPSQVIHLPALLPQLLLAEVFFK